MKILTVNMCMEAGDIHRRMDALGKLIHSTKPEFVALQSVTNDMVKKIPTTSWGTRYKFVQPPTKFETRGKPSVAILSIYPIEKSQTATFHETPTKKSYFRAFFIMHDKLKQPHIINLCTSQLESGFDMTEVRECQLNEALLSTLEDEDCFVVGDLSICNEIDGGVILQGDWKDAWLEQNGKDDGQGNTVDPELNPLLRGSSLTPGRPDRILYRVCRYKLDSVEVVGKEPISGVGTHVSSHYGVLASFTMLDPTDIRPFKEQGPVACLFDRPM